MRWVFLAFLLALGAAGCGSTKSAGPDGGNPYRRGRLGTEATLEVMTWNLEHFAKRGAATVQEVADVVTGLQPDIVALQEIRDADRFSQLDAALSGWSGQRAASASFQLNLAFLYRTDGPLQVDAVYEILTDHPRELPRSPYVLEGSFRGVAFVVINNHFKARGDNVLDPANPWDEETRRRDASALLADFIRAHYADRPVVVLGDFNDELTDPAEANVFQNFLDLEAEFRFVDWAIATGGPEGWSYPAWPSHLDHILITRQWFAAAANDEAAVVVPPLPELSGRGWSAYENNVSDHLPVVLRLRP